MLASLNTPGEMRIFAKRSRNHTELMFKNLKMPISVKKKGEIDFIKASRPDKLSSFNLDIPGDISSSAFFIALTILSKNSHLVLKNINLNINPRQVIGLTGKSGCGKSTLTKLLVGLYRPKSGMISYDNSDLRLLDLSHLRSQVSLVDDSSYFFPGTIRENIARPMPNSSMDRIIWAAKKVSAHEEIENFVEGYETVLEENAANLSTGMRQKLQIARALIRNPRILIFDDAISGFDVDSEIKLYDALEDISVGRTVIIVSSRLWPVSYTHLTLPTKRIV
mgnify:CR=1 FL=1